MTHDVTAETPLDKVELTDLEISRIDELSAFYKTQLELVDTGGGTKAHIRFKMKGAIAYDEQFDFDRG